MNTICTAEEIRTIYMKIREDVRITLESMDKISRYKDQKRFISEFVFCLLTPQSKAREADKAVEGLKKANLLSEGGISEIKPLLKRVRFYNNKASYIIRNRPVFLSAENFEYITNLKNCNIEIREFLVQNVVGYGYKEASHFLRNIGRGQGIAILDRHILKGLCDTGCICEFPKSISRGAYLEIEQKLVRFSKAIGIDVRYLDFVFWYRKTKDIFK